MAPESDGTPTRQKALLKSRLEDRLVNYAMCAGAAGVGLLAAVPAEAQIVYTPANIHFERGADLDINNDGVTDFVITQSGRSFTFSFGPDRLKVGGAPGNRVRGYTQYNRYLWASRLAKGAKIGGSRHGFYRNQSELMATFSSYSFGAWRSGTSGFLGLEFQIDGQVHYGWAEVRITGGAPPPQGPFRGVVKGYAYNTVPTQPIRAGQTSDDDFMSEEPTLGALALGSLGLSLWRQHPIP